MQSSTIAAAVQKGTKKIACKVQFCTWPSTLPLLRKMNEFFQHSFSYLGILGF